MHILNVRALSASENCLRTSWGWNGLFRLLGAWTGTIVSMGFGPQLTLSSLFVGHVQ